LRHYHSECVYSGSYDGSIGFWSLPVPVTGAPAPVMALGGGGGGGSGVGGGGQEAL